MKKAPLSSSPPSSSPPSSSPPSYLYLGAIKLINPEENYATNSPPPQK